MSNLVAISGVRGFIDKNGVAQLNAEDVARGFGFTQIKNGVEYVRWDRTNEYLTEFGFSPQVGKEDFIPENMAYRLGFKANNETAQIFQAKLADEILPAIRQTGTYITGVDTSKLSPQMQALTLMVQQLAQMEIRQKRPYNLPRKQKMKLRSWRPKSKLFLMNIIPLRDMRVCVGLR